MGTQFIAKTNQQQIPEIAISARSTSTPFTFYSCPTGKKARFDGYVNCTNTGAASVASWRAPTNLFNWISWEPALPLSAGNLLVGNRFRVDNFQMDAGDGIFVTQDIGTNAEFEVIGKILELPA